MQTNQGGLRKLGILKNPFPGQPLITIITVVYNGQSFLPITINSVTSQTYKNIEYVIIDGGSKDKTLDIIQQNENKIDYWLSEPDKGIYDAMNKGINLSTGQWLLFLNAGDTFASDQVLTKVSEFISMNKANMVFGDVNIVTKDGNSNVRILKNTTPFLLRNMICHQCIFYSKRLLENIGGFNTQYKFIADFEHLMKARYQNGNIKKIDLVIANYDLEGVSAKPENIKKIWRERMTIFKEAKYMPLPIRWFFWLYAKAAYEYRRMF
jgi:glycosyltransferase involved in cell wall biosynthesis